MKSFDDKVVLDQINLEIERGETCVIIGGSGSGKTTLARILVGLDRPTSGSVIVDGTDLAQLSDAELTRFRTRFAVVFQRAALLDSMTVFDNVAFPLREETDLDEKAIAERVLAALRELDVENAARKLPAELSGGMAKRVGIARAVVTEPEIIVYDEPTSGLDPVSSRVVDGLIERMRENHFVTSVVITHDMVTAYEVADRVLLLAQGKIAAAGPPEDLFREAAGDIEPFARSSGIDIERLVPRGARTPPAIIRERWEAAHPKQEEQPRHFGIGWLTG